MKRALRGMIGVIEGADRWLLVSMGLMLFMGIFVVYGAGSYNRHAAQTPLGDHFIVIKHLIMIGLGGVLLLVLAHIDYHWWRHPWLNRGALLVSYMAVAMTLVLARHDADGNRLISRWLTVGGFSLQPVELAKMAMILFMADRLAGTRQQIRLTGREVLKTLAIGPGLLMVLLFMQPNYGNVMVVGGVTVVMLYLTGTADRVLRWLAIVMPVSIVLGYFFIGKITERIDNLVTGLRGGSFGHQVNQSLIGIGAGGIQGLGVGQSHNKYAFLPEAHTDFIYSVIGEEMGLAGSLGVILLLMVFVWRGLGIARRAADPFGRVVAAGLTCALAIYGITNLAMVIGLFPVVGVPLPFISFGGTAMLAALAAIGVLLNIDRGGRSYSTWKRRWDRGGMP